MIEPGDTPTRVVVLGSTGSIGKSTISVIEHDQGRRLRAWGLSAHKSWLGLVEQARSVRPRFVTVTDIEGYERLRVELRGAEVEVLVRA